MSNVATIVQPGSIGVMNPFALAVPLLMAAMVVWQVVTGKFLSRRWCVVITRETNPAKFWMMICLQLMITIFAWRIMWRAIWR